MGAYIIRRTLYLIPTVLGVALVVFFIFNVVGGNPVYRILGPHATQEAIESMEHQLGLDKPLHFQFIEYIKNIVTLDFGRSWKTRQTIASMVADGIIPSLSLTLPAFMIATLASIGVSLFCAFYRNSLSDRIIVILSVAAMSISSLAYIIFGQYFLAYKLNLFPISGYTAGIQAVRYLLLPIIIYVLLTMGPDVRLYRTIILDEINMDYVRTAYSKGLTKKRVMFKHVLKNALIPIITQVVVIIPFLFTGSLLLENFFGIPGLGNMMVNAIFNEDRPVMQAMTFIFSVIFVLANLISDICYTLVDPRVRLK